MKAKPQRGDKSMSTDVLGETGAAISNACNTVEARPFRAAKWSEIQTGFSPRREIKSWIATQSLQLRPRIVPPSNLKHPGSARALYQGAPLGVPTPLPPQTCHSEP
jgi:hypothetical protein